MIYGYERNQVRKGVNKGVMMYLEGLKVVLKNTYRPRN
jgi:hypothetical protein